MTIRDDTRTVIDLNGKVNFNVKEAIRGFLLDTWKAESQNTSYRYFVEILSNGKRIYLERPASLNKGCDFKIYAEDLLLHKNGNDKPPSHKDIIDDLQHKAQENAQSYQRLVVLIEKVYQCDDFDEIIEMAKEIPFHTGWSCETLLKLIKWFFIEQDITYWNGVGRRMFWDAIQRVSATY